MTDVSVVYAEVIVCGYFRLLNALYNARSEIMDIKSFIKLILLFHGNKALYTYHFKKENLGNKVAMILTIPDLRKNNYETDGGDDKIQCGVLGLDERREGILFYNILYKTL